MRQRPPVTETFSKTGEPKRSLFQSAVDVLFGYDFFISYAWKDARSYAVALAEELRTQGFECFLDSTEYAKGDDWRRTGKRALRKTSKLLLLGSPAGLDSEAVLHEVEAFQSTNRKIVPIDFGETLCNPPDFMPAVGKTIYGYSAHCQEEQLQPNRRGTGENDSDKVSDRVYQTKVAR